MIINEDLYIFIGFQKKLKKNKLYKHFFSKYGTYYM